MKHEVRLIGGQWKRSKLPVADRPGLRSGSWASSARRAA